MCEWMWERARACGRGSPRSPAERGARGGRRLSPALSCEASSAPVVQLPTPRRESGELLATLVQSTGKPGSRRVLLLRSPQRKRRRSKAGAPPRQLGDLLSRRDAAAPAKARQAWSSGGPKRLPSAAALPGGRRRQTSQSPGSGAESGHQLPERAAALRPGEAAGWRRGRLRRRAPLSVVLKPRSPPALGVWCGG